MAKENGGGIAESLGNMIKGDTLGGNALNAALGKLGGLGAVSDGFTLIPGTKEKPTTVDLFIEKAEMKKASTGNTMIKLQLRVVGGGDDFDKTWLGVKVWDQIVLTENSIWKAKNLFRVTDTLSDDGETFIGDSEKDLQGHYLSAQVYIDKYDGKDSNKIKGGFKPPLNKYDEGAGGSTDAPKF